METRITKVNLDLIFSRWILIWQFWILLFPSATENILTETSKTFGKVSLFLANKLWGYTNISRSTPSTSPLRMIITPSLRTCFQGSLVLLALICKGFPRIVKLFVMAFLHPKICKTALIASSVINKEFCCSNEMQLFPQFGIYTHLYTAELGILLCHFSWYICQQMMCFKRQMKITFTFVSLSKSLDHGHLSDAVANDEIPISQQIPTISRNS